MEAIQIEGNVIEEKIQEVEIKKIFDIFYSINKDLFTSKEIKLSIDYESLGKGMGLSIELCNDLYAIKDSVAIFVYYKEEQIPPYFRVVEVEDSSKNLETYHIYRYQFCYDLITKQKKFTNPIIIVNKKFEDFNKLKVLFSSTIEKFKIIDLKMIKYDYIFNQKESKDINQITGFSLSENFKHYFKYPKSDDIFIYHYSHERTKLYEFGKKEKIKAICGNFGIGKSTTFLIAKKSHPEIIYFNLKVLMEKQRDILFWKYEVFLKEIAYSFQKTSTYKVFKSLEENLKNIITIWECITYFVKFVLTNNIKAKIVIDQYKESYDENYHYINSIILVLNSEENIKKDTFKLLICSSINNNDVRNCLLDTWFDKETSKGKPLFQYIYFYRLFDSKKLISEDSSLSQEQKNLIENDFNYIPRFYYDIKSIKNNSLKDYKNSQADKIFEKIRKFYETDGLSIDKTFKILEYRQKIGKTLGQEESYNFLQLVPLKYFIHEKDTVDFYFPLVEKQFDIFLSERLSEILKFPLPGIKEGTIGDILEFILVNDLKNNKFDQFQEIFKVDSIWNLNKVERANINEIQKKNILILQTDTYAKFVDIGILNKAENLILIQCKKALSAAPKDYITKEKILEYRKIIRDSFNSKFGVNIKRINLMYVTGINTNLYEKEKHKKYKTWGNKESETFEILEDMCKKGECILIYYDPIIKQNFIKSLNEELIMVDSYINILDSFESVVIEDINEELQKQEKSSKRMKKYIFNTLNDLFEPFKPIKDETEKFFDIQDCSQLLKIGLNVNTNILAVRENPEPEDFMINNIYIGFKRNRKKYLCYKEKNKKRKIYEIDKTNINEKEIELYDLMRKEKIDKCYYLDIFFSHLIIIKLVYFIFCLIIP